MRAKISYILYNRDVKTGSVPVQGISGKKYGTAMRMPGRQRVEMRMTEEEYLAAIEDIMGGTHRSFSKWVAVAQVEQDFTPAEKELADALDAKTAECDQLSTQLAALKANGHAKPSPQVSTVVDTSDKPPILRVNLQEGTATDSMDFTTDFLKSKTFRELRELAKSLGVPNIKKITAKDDMVTAIQSHTKK